MFVKKKDNRQQFGEESVIDETGKYGQKAKEYVQRVLADRLATAATNHRHGGQRNLHKSCDKMEGLLMARSGNTAPKSCE
jgi:hypothetical protein